MLTSVTDVLILLYMHHLTSLLLLDIVRAAADPTVVLGRPAATPMRFGRGAAGRGKAGYGLCYQEVEPGVCKAD